MIALVLAALQDAAPAYAPHVEPASDEPQRVMHTFQLPPGFEIDCYAAEPRLAHPVCFWIARSGECYVAETFRHHAGVTDIRDHMDWLDDDVASRTVEDRVKMYRKFLGQDFASFESEHERIRLLRDTDGDGRIDSDTVFADDFHAAADGIGAGLIERDGRVYYACIPNLWRLRDTNHDGRADERELLSTGWGVRVALLGHDMHGLQVGPDGKLYWSIGDRGFSVTTKEGDLIEHPFTGAVLRSNLDGTGLEVFATGLRNPQELAFDDFGNLWTGDNNSDGGDRARLVHVIEGSDAGWRQAFQWIETPNLRGPWNDERWWLPHFDGQAAFLVPPVANLANGPSGLAIDPGTGLSRDRAGWFFLCDFTGSSEASGILTFKVEPRGASYVMLPFQKFLWGPLATDCDFGLDGGLYVSDWVAGWNKTGKGRIWRVFERDVCESAVVRETKELLQGGMKLRGEPALAALLHHADRRVRLDAELELAARGTKGLDEFVRVARDRDAALLARLHAVWGLEVAHAAGEALVRATLSALFTDPDAEVRAQAARVAGDLRAMDAVDTLIRMLRDPSARVRLYAAIGLARTRRDRAFEPLLALLREVGQQDPHLRHAATYALAYCSTVQKLASLAEDPSPDVRVAAVVALRRAKSPLISRFLEDRDERVAAEAARAVYDTPILDSLDALAVLIHRPGFATRTARVPVAPGPEAFLAGDGYARRVLAANFHSAMPDRRAALAELAANAAADPDLRAEALDYLARWAAPSGRDRFSGEWWPVPARDPDGVRADALRLGSLLGDDAPVPVLRGWLRLVAGANVVEVAPRVTELARDVTRPGSLRAEALATLGKLAPAGVAEIAEGLLFDGDRAVRAAAIALFREVAPDRALPVLERALGASIPERRAAYQGLAKFPGEYVDELLSSELTALDHGERPPAIALDLVLAAEARSAERVQARLAARKEARRADEKTAPYLDTLFGGDAARGRELFRAKSSLECLRCHTAQGEGGAVGPALDRLSTRATRMNVLESIVDPNRAFAPGFRGTVVFPKDGAPVEGVLVEDTPEHVVLLKGDGSRVTLARDEIEGTKPGLSSMPANLAEHLSREEMRDLIEYLESL